jgi:hypothetical protein
MTHHPAHSLKATVYVDPSTFVKTVTFDAPITKARAIEYCFGAEHMDFALTPLDEISGRTRRFRLDTHDGITLMRLRGSLRDAVIKGSLIRTRARPDDFPSFVPLSVRDDILHGKFKGRVGRYPGNDDWGDIVVWHYGDQVQIYQEFPEDLNYYLQVNGDVREARLLHAAYTQYNRDMRDFVDGKGMSPENARARLRAINEEVFKLILEGAVTILNSGAGITQVNAVMRSSADKVAGAVKRNPRIKVTTAKLKPVADVVNVGGGLEHPSPNCTNLNPVRVGTGGPTSGIPNHILGTMEEMDSIFEAGSAQKIVSNRLRYGDINWTKGAAAAYRVAKPGGQVSMNVWCNNKAEQIALEEAFSGAGFKSVKVFGDGPGTLVTGLK